jgi:DNA-binding GntR family transcriptional regulator
LSILLYKSVAEQIKRKISEREWVNKMPSEPVLCELFHVSRITLRRAVQELCKEGLITKRHGLGMFIDADTYNPHQINAGKLYSENCKFHTIHVLRNIKPADEIAKTLRIKPNEKVVEVHRIAYFQEYPVSYITVRIPEKLYKVRFFEDMVGDSVFIPSLKKIGITITHTAVTIEPFILQEQQPLIMMEKGDLALSLRRIGYSEKEAPIFVINHIMNGKYSAKILKISTTHH